MNEIIGLALFIGVMVIAGWFAKDHADSQNRRKEATTTVEG